MKTLIEKLQELKNNDTDWDNSYWNQSIERCINIAREHFASPELVEQMRQTMQRESIVTGVNKETINYTIDCKKAAMETIESIMGDASHEGAGVDFSADAALQPSPASNPASLSSEAQIASMSHAAPVDAQDGGGLSSEFLLVNEVAGAAREYVNRRECFADSKDGLNAFILFGELQAAKAEAAALVDELVKVMQENVDWHTNYYGSSEIACINIEALTKAKEWRKK